MILITSAQYVESDLRVEVGRIPPVALPVGNRVLLSFQLEKFQAFRRPGELLQLSLPEDFTPNSYLLELFQKYDVTVTYVPLSLGLAESVLYAMNSHPQFLDRVVILHGDTLAEEFPDDEDCVALTPAPSEYDWEPDVAAPHKVWAGFFAFASAPLLSQSLVRNMSDFVAGVREYGETRPPTTPLLRGWRDFGHVHTYFDSRSMISTARSFNSLSIRDGIVRKTSSMPGKMEREFLWFEALPLSLRPFTPAYYGRLDDGGYALEFLPQCPLNEVFVHGRLEQGRWGVIFASFAAWFRVAREGGHSNHSALNSRRFLLETKTHERFSSFCDSQGFNPDLQVSLNGRRVGSAADIIADCLNRARRLPLVPGFLHGDLCLSNTFFDTRASRLRVLDPRGTADGVHSGDLVYDLAKLAHSILGLYDEIIAGGFTIAEGPERGSYSFTVETPDNYDRIIQQFVEFRFLPEVATIDVVPVMVLLFFSMLPLHADNPARQRALLLNAFRCYSDFVA